MGGGQRGQFPLNLWGKNYYVSVLSDTDIDVKNIQIRHWRNRHICVQG